MPLIFLVIKRHFIAFYPYLSILTGNILPFMDTDPKTHQTIAEMQSQLGARILANRLNRNLTQKDVAAKAGVSLRTLRSLERGGRSTVSTLIAVLRGMDLPTPLDSLVATAQVSPFAMLRSMVMPKRARKKAVKP